MKIIRIKPVEILGGCPAKLTMEDEFQIAGMNLENPKGSKLCFLAVSQIPIGQGIWQTQRELRFFSHVSCPGCISSLEEENRVVFLLGHADKWELCQIISEYLRLCQQHQEPEAAIKLKKIAIQQQEQGEFSAAMQTMRTALKTFTREIT